VSLGVNLHVELRPEIRSREMFLEEGEPATDFLFCDRKVCIFVKSRAPILDSYALFDALHGDGLTYAHMSREHIEINVAKLKFLHFWRKWAILAIFS
jgi:hypothetical protein